ncbi:MAG: amino acid ABC transporter substrate-binding protein [Oscillospiraceae bacterium]|nr:amino acid ABC transporter substrate-binding protein [Oscillospiraceae bacterium]
MKKLMALLLAVICIFTFAGCSAQNSAAERLENKQVIIGVDDTFAPMGFRDEQGNLVGFDIDLANELLGRMGYTAEFQVIDWSMKEAELENGNIDLIWNGYTITDKRKEKVNFTQSYLSNRQIIIVLADSEIKTKSQLADKTVAVQKESSAYDAVMADDIAAKLAGGEPVQFDTNTDAFMDLEAGRSDAMVADEVFARYYIKLRGEEKYKVLGDDFGNEEYGIGVRKSDTELLKEIDDTLGKMMADGSFDRLKSEWFSE